MQALVRVFPIYSMSNKKKRVVMMKHKRLSEKKIWKQVLKNDKINSPVLMVKIDVDDYQIVVTHGLN